MKWFKNLKRKKQHKIGPTELDLINLQLFKLDVQQKVYLKEISEEEALEKIKKYSREEFDRIWDRKN